MTVRRTMMFCADTMRIFSSITTRASVSIEAVLFSVFRTGVLSYLRVFLNNNLTPHLQYTFLYILIWNKTINYLLSPQPRQFWLSQRINKTFNSIKL